MRRAFVFLLCVLAPASALAALRGVVYSSTGRPVANAKVEVFETEPYEAAADRALTRGAAPAALASTSTAADGGFTIDPARSGFLQLAVSAAGFAPVRQSVRSDDADVAIALAPAAARVGHIRAAGKPVAGATVVLFGAAGHALVTTRTDDAGAFTAPDPTGWASSLCAVHNAYAPKCSWASETPGSLRLDLVLDSGVAVTGRVLGADGKPAPGVPLFAGRFPAGKSGEDGSFTLAHVPDDAKVISAAGPHGVGRAARSASAITITLTPGRSMTGSVRDEKGRGIGGVTIAVQPMTTEAIRFHSTVTAPDGQYRIAGLDADNMNAWSIDPPDLDIDAAQVDLRRADGRHDFVGKENSWLRGSVVDEEKHPVGGATVALGQKQQAVFYGTTQQRVATVSGPDGRFRLPNMAAAAELAVFAIHPDYAAGVTAVGKAESKPVTIVLPRGMEAAGVVKDESGQPIAGARLVAASASSMLGTFPLAPLLASGLVSEWVKADAAGQFTMHLGSGPHDLGIWRDGYAAKTVSIEVSKTLKPLAIVLQRGSEIRGHVTTGDGRPAGPGMVYAMRESEEQGAQGTLEEDGSFVLRSITPGKYLVRVQTEKGAASTLVTAPALDVVLTLPKQFQLTGRVLDKATGQPVTAFDLAASAADVSFYDSETFSDPAGSFQMQVPAGSVTLNVKAKGYVPLERALTIDGSAGPSPLDLHVVKGRRIHGRVTTSSGAAVAEVGVSAVESDGAAQTDDQGEYELDAAPTAPVTVKFAKSGFVSATKSVAEGADDQRVDVVLSAGNTITGRVVDAAGAPVGEAQVFASSAAHNADPQFTRSEKDGTFTVAGLAPALYKLSASKSGVGEAKEQTVDANKPASVTLTLVAKRTGRVRGTLSGFAEANWITGMATAESEGDRASAQIGRDGHFLIEDVAAGSVNVAAFLMSPNRATTSRRVRVEVPVGGEVEVQLSLADGVSISGRVTSGGQPVVGASVGLYAQGGMWRAMTAGDGTYEITGLEPARYSVTIAQTPGPTYQKEIDISSTATFDFDIAQARIAGRVIDARNAPVEGAHVAVESSSGSAGHVSEEASTDSTGAFSIGVQADQVYRVSASKKGFASSTTEVDARTAASPVTLRLQAAAAGRVRLVDARTGMTLSGFVVVSDENGVMLTSASDTDPDGTIPLPLVAGTYRVSASADGFASQTVRVSVPSEETRIALTPGGTLIVTAPENARELMKLVLPNGEEYVRCYCNRIAEIRLEGALTKVEHVAPASYRMDVYDARGVKMRSVPVTILENQTATVDITK